MKRSLGAGAKTLLILFLVILCGLFFMGEYNLFSLFKLRGEIALFDAEIEVEEKKHASLAQTLDKLKNDPAHLEKVAREKFKMGREDEKIYIFKDGE